MVILTSAKHQPITAARIKAARQHARELGRDVWISDDHGIRGFGRLVARITPHGVERFYYRGLHAGVRRTIPLGPYSRTRKSGLLTIQQARTAASNFVPLGSEVTRPSTIAPPPPSPTQGKRVALTVLELCQLYLQSLQRAKKVSAADVEGHIRRLVETSDLAHLPAHRVTSIQFTQLLRTVVDSGKGRTARKLRSILHAAYALALKASLSPSQSAQLVDNCIVSNPITAIEKLSEFDVPRDRALGKTELAKFWAQLNPIDDSDVSIQMRLVRLTILLGGQRCEQLLRATVANVDLDAKSILLFDGKGRRRQPRQHLLPIVATAMNDVSLLIQCAKSLDSPHLFPGSRKNVPLAAETVSKLVTSMSKSLLREEAIRTPFSYLDIRRTIETLFPTIGVTQEVSAQIQSHGLSGIQFKHYNRHNYMEEKRRALEKWERFLLSLLDVERGLAR